jgi:hypothetical protein
MNRDMLNANTFYNGFDPHVNTRNKGGKSLTGRYLSVDLQLEGESKRQ